MKRLLIAPLLLLLVACVPVANLGAGLIEDADGASLHVLADGMGFDAGDETALGVIMVVAFDTLESYQAPEGASCTLDGVLDCRLGDVESRTVVELVGTNVSAFATFRRSGSSTVYRVIE